MFKYRLLQSKVALNWRTRMVVRSRGTSLPRESWNVCDYEGRTNKGKEASICETERHERVAMGL